MAIDALNCPFCGSLIKVGADIVKECPSCKKSLHIPVRETKGTGVMTLEKAEPAKTTVPTQVSFSLSGQSTENFGPYRIERKIGQGGMGFVYEALDTRLNRRVALKTIEVEGIDEAAVARFRQEAKHSAKLRHPNIVSVHDVGREGGFDYFTMDLVEGVTLDKWLKTCKPSLAHKIKIMEKTARALHYAHTQGVVHRDIKPGNIMIDGNGEPQIMDFGLARNTKDSSNLTLSGSIVGTPAYMAPEQTMGGAHDVGAVTDVWGLGVVLYEILTDKSPFDTGNVYQTIYAVLHSEPEPLRKLRPELPRDLEIVVLKCLEKNAERRYKSAEALANDLTAWLEGRPIGVRGITWWEKLLKRLRRHRAISVDEFVIEQEARQRAEAQRMELQTRVESESKKEWRLVFEEDFSDPDVESRWEIIANVWEVKEGELRMQGGVPQIMYLRTPMAGDLKLEFECRQEGDVLGDMSCFFSALMLMNRKKACESGYMFQFAGVANTKSFIEKPKKRFIERQDTVVGGKKYKICAEKYGSRLTLTIDGVTIFDVEDADPLMGLDRVSMGIYGWISETFYSNIKVYRMGLPVKADILEMAEKQLQMGKYEFAIELFEEVRTSQEDPIRQERARKGLEKAKSSMELSKIIPQCEKKIRSIGEYATIELGAHGFIVSVREQNLSSLEAVRGIPIVDLDCSINDIQSLEPLSEMHMLSRLVANHNRILNLDPLKSLKLQELSVTKNPGISLEALRGSELLNLNCSNSEVSDLSPLADSKLSWLSLDENRIETIKDLKNLPLKRLQLGGNKIKDFSPLHGMHLNKLVVENNQIEDLSCFLKCSVNELFCFDNPITTIEPLLDNPPPTFYYDSESLPTSMYEKAAKYWREKGLIRLANEAKVLFHIRHKDVAGLKGIAERMGNRLVLFVPKFVSWKEADRLAKEWGGGLLILKGLEERRKLLDIKARYTAAWVGLIKTQNERRWTDGQICDPQVDDFAENMPPTRAEKFFAYTLTGSTIRYHMENYSFRAAFFVQWPL